MPTESIATVGPQTTIHAAPEEEEEEIGEEVWSAAWDDVTGQAFDPHTVAQARAKEMQYIHRRS